MRTFVAVVRVGSFTGAAERLGISKALASKYVNQLEAHLGVRLLHRTTRSLSVTDAGELCFSRGLRLVDEFDEIQALLQDRDPHVYGRLAITAPTDFGELFLANAVAEFAKEQPRVTIELDLSDRYVDLIEGGFDLGIRIGEANASNEDTRMLQPINVVVCASAAYLRVQGVPETPEDLAHHSCIVDTNFRGGHQWPFQRGGRKLSVPVNARVRVNSARAAREMLVADVGIALCPEFAVRADIESGQLRPLLTEFTHLKLGLFTVYPTRQPPAKVETFTTFLKSHFARTGGSPWF